MSENNYLWKQSKVLAKSLLKCSGKNTLMTLALLDIDINFLATECMFLLIESGFI